MICSFFFENYRDHSKRVLRHATTSPVSKYRGRFLG